MDKLKRKVAPLIYKALIDANINSLSSIVNQNHNKLVDITKLPFDSVKFLKSEVAKIVLDNAIIRVKQVKEWKRINTGCPSINKITSNGLPVNGVNEIYGCSGVGKTQLCLQLSLMVQLPEELGGLHKDVIYICTDHVFPSKRLHQLAQTFQMEYQKYCKSDFEDNIFIKHIADFVQLKACIFDLIPKLLRIRKVGLIVIDTIAGVFRSDNLDVNYIDRSQQLVALASQLNRISAEHELAVLCVNQVMDNPATGNTEPCLGLTWSNLVTSRFAISRHGDSHTRGFEICFSPDLDTQMCKFLITKEGLI